MRMTGMRDRVKIRMMHPSNVAEEVEEKVLVSNLEDWKLERMSEASWPQGTGDRSAKLILVSVVG